MDGDRSDADLFAYDTLVTISSDGTNTWMKPLVVKVTCILDFLYFPYDDQECKLTFGSWGYDISQIDISGLPQYINSSEYIANGQWQLLAITSTHHIKKYTCCIHPYATYEIAVSVRRCAGSPTVNIVIPSAILSALILLSFLLPPESGERVALCITVILSVTVFQQMTAQMMPPASVPYLAQYYFSTIVITSLSLVATTGVLNLFFGNSGRMSRWLRRIILHWLGTLMYCRKIQKRLPPFAFPGVAIKPCNLLPSSKEDDCDKESGKSAQDAVPNGTIEDDDEDKMVATRQLVTDGPENYFNSLSEMRKKEARKMVNVLDRFFFILFSVAMIMSLVVVFIRAPRFTGEM